MEYTKGSLKIVKEVERESLFGSMDNITMVSGYRIKSMEVGYGHHHTLNLTLILTLVSGRMVKSMDMEYILGVKILILREQS